MQFALELAVLECSFQNHSQGILGVQIEYLMNKNSLFIKNEF
jgi:hypothetical protein